MNRWCLLVFQTMKRWKQLQSHAATVLLIAAVFMKAAGGSDQSFSSASFDTLEKNAQLAARRCLSNEATIQSDWPKAVIKTGFRLNSSTRHFLAEMLLFCPIDTLFLKFQSVCFLTIAIWLENFSDRLAHLVPLYMLQRKQNNQKVLIHLFNTPEAKLCHCGLTSVGT